MDNQCSQRVFQADSDLSKFLAGIKLIIHLKLYSILREKLPPEAKGQTDLELEEGETLAGLLDELEISRRVVVSINGDHVSDRSHRLQDGDEIKIFSSISGG